MVSRNSEACANLKCIAGSIAIFVGTSADEQSHPNLPALFEPNHSTMVQPWKVNMALCAGVNPISALKAAAFSEAHYQF